MFRKVLIVKIAAIGDVIMALPMLEVVRKQYPEAKITWLCGETVAPLLSAVRNVDQIIAIDERKLLGTNSFIRLSAVIRIWIRLLGRRFDLVLTGHADPRYRILTLMTFADKRRSFIRNGKHSRPVPGRHHTDEYVRLVTNADGPGCTQTRLPKVSIPLPEHLKSLLHGDAAPVVAMAPGGARNTLSDDEIRRWPLEKYVALANLLLNSGVRVLITGAASDEWIRSAFTDPRVVDLVGKTSLIDLLAIYAECDVVVTHDSGPLHLAGLGHTPTVALFGPTNPHEKVPRVDGTIILWGGEKLTCRPCYDGKYYAVCTNNLCMRSISVEMAVKAVFEILDNKAAAALTK